MQPRRDRSFHCRLAGQPKERPHNKPVGGEYDASLDVTPAYWRSAESRFETVAARQINHLTALAGKAQAAAQTWARVGSPGMSTSRAARIARLVDDSKRPYNRAER